MLNLSFSERSDLSMGSSAILDYALFQLTPTRTRCDLVVVSGGKSEKIASGLVETFSSHLKFAKDQILKGGYSITLRPPFPNAVWFTKPTFQRFVRFVSTPEILERFVRIERELMQIETSIQSNEGRTSHPDGITKKPNNSYKFKNESEREDGAAVEETSKLNLQRHLNARKALLRKEQAMAYARAMVAGFEIELMDNLICFADAFGALRLRQVCIDFKELCKQKHTDGQWMEELAAMKACSSQELPFIGAPAIILACENGASQSNNLNSTPNTCSDSSSAMTASPPHSDGTRDNNLAESVQTAPTPAKVQLQMPWPNQFPQYVYQSQNQVQRIPLCQGYPLPNVHPSQPFYPGHIRWSQIMGNHTNGKNHDYHKSSRRKEKKSNVKESEASEDDEQTESHDSDSIADQDAIREDDSKLSSRDKPHTKKHKKKSSKTVVIRNINYITSKKSGGDKHVTSDDSSSVEALEDEAIIREVDEAVGFLKKHQQSKVLNSKKSSNHILNAQNGSNGYADQDLAHDQDFKISEEEEKNDNRNAFQNLLRNHELTSNGVELQHPVNFQDEHREIKRSDDGIFLKIRQAVDLISGKDKMQHLTDDDSILLTRSNKGSDSTLDSIDVANGENVLPTMKERDHIEVPLISKRLEGTVGDPLSTLSDFASEAPNIRNIRKEEDWFIINNSGNMETKDAKQIIFDQNNTICSGGDSSFIEAIKSAASVDDSFMVQPRSEDDLYDSQWRTDISTVVNWNTALLENGDANVAESKPKISGTNEPDDLCVVLARDVELESTGTSWTPEMDYRVEMHVMDIDKISNSVEPKSKTEDKLPVNGKSTNTKKNSGPAIKNSVKDTRSRLLQGSVAKSKPQSTSRLMVQKSKFKKEEEVRKKMEELVLQRQKRIAERTAAGGFTPVASKGFPGGSKSATSKLEMPRPHSKVRETKV